MELPNRTKIICTIGPAVSSLDKMIELIRSGMNVARLNFSHGTHEEHLNRIESLKETRKQLQVPLAIMLDTKGPEIRLGKIKQGSVELKAGQKWLLVKEKIEGDAERVTVLPESIYNQIQTGMCVLFDDGYISSYVMERTAEGIVVKIENGGVIRSGKGVNIPNVSLELPDITPEDDADIRFGCRQDIDIIAASFVRSPEQILAIKKLLAEEKKSDILVIAKIENSEGVENFDSIVQVADGIMIARGDLGVEVPLSHGAQAAEDDDPQMLSRGKAVGHSDADARIDDQQPEADTRRSLRCGQRHLRLHLSGHALRRNSDRQISYRCRQYHEEHHQRGRRRCRLPRVF